MCLLSFFPENVQPNSNELNIGCENNPDGAGYAIVLPDQGRIITGRSMDGNALVKTFVALRALHPDGPALFHSRITTDGVTSIENCHPFPIGGDNRTIMAHNGVLPARVRPGKNDPRSDTRICAEQFLPGHHFMDLDRRGSRKNFESWLGSGSKVVILTVDPRYRRNSYVLNEHLGMSSLGAWHSNSSFQAWSTRTISYRSFWPIGENVSPYKPGQIIGQRSGETLSDSNCAACGAYYSVNAVTGYCSLCRCCIECYEVEESCLCYVPARLKSAVKSDISYLMENDPFLRYDDAAQIAKEINLSDRCGDSDDLDFVEGVVEEANFPLAPTHGKASVVIVGAGDDQAPGGTSDGIIDVDLVPTRPFPESTWNRCTPPDPVSGFVWCTDGHGYWWAEREKRPTVTN